MVENVERLPGARESVRRKLQEQADLIETVRGVGYRFRDPRAVE